MKIKYVFFLVFCIFLLTGCQSGQKEQFTEFLKNNDYQSKSNCLQKTITKDEGTIVQRFCLDECKYYAMDSVYDDFFTLDIQKQAINYIYDYISYQYNMKSNKVMCFFQGEEIDANSSYCSTARQIVDQHLNYFQTELNQANVNMEYICK